MRKVIASINLTIDGFCDHTAMVADEELHDHYTSLLNDSGILLYGRTTYQLMEEYWPKLVATPSGEKSMDEFALAIEAIPKLVFSKTLKKTNWKNVALASKGLAEELTALKKQEGRNILVGSPSLIAQLTNQKLIDEFQLCVHPVVAGTGLPLFKGVTDRSVLKLTQTKTFGTGVLAQYYEVINK